VLFGGTVLESVAGEQPRGPQFMRITQLLRLPAQQRAFASSVIVGSPNDRFARPQPDVPLESVFDHFGNRGEYAVSPLLAFLGSP
jgi:hypothetical protein